MSAEADFPPALNVSMHNISLLLEDYASFKENVNAVYLLTMGALVMFMQGGFAMLEAGSLRSKNLIDIVGKTMVDTCFGGIAFWVCGFAFAFGEGNAFIGYDQFILWALPKSSYAYLFFQASFAASTASLASGCIAERSDFAGNIISTSLITGFVYPVQAHWGWGPGGWLASNGFHDFAGSGLVHLAGGTCAFVACCIIGPGKDSVKTEKDQPRQQGHFFPMICLGYFTLLFGFFGFNGGALGSITNPGDGGTIALVIFATFLSCCSGTIAVLLVQRLRTGYWKMAAAINGGVVGLVSVCCGCDGFYPWSACLTGAVAGIVYLLMSWIVEKMHFDDPLEIIAIHAGGGMWGLIAGPLLRENGILSSEPLGGAKMLLWNLIGLIAIIVWNSCLTMIIFGVLKLLGLFRVPEEYEVLGLDASKHDETAYPEWSDQSRHEVHKTHKSGRVFPDERNSGKSFPRVINIKAFDNDMIK